MLKLDMRVGETVEIGDGVRVTLERKGGQMARLAISADKSVLISRVPSRNDSRQGRTQRKE